MSNIDLPDSAKATSDKMDKIVSLCKRRGFIFPGSEIYGGLANSWDYGPLGVELKNNIKNAWWDRYVHRRDDMVGIDAALMMSSKVWEASGHLKEFSDPLVECKKCNQRFRDDNVAYAQDQLDAGNKAEEYTRLVMCPKGGQHTFSDIRMFNLMFKTSIGSTDDGTGVVYFRPETAQSMFVNFKNVLDTARKTLPFGIAQVGKAFRNEITPGNFIFRTREFEQMEIEYFIREADWQTYFEHWQKEMWSWMIDVLGLDKSKIHELQVSPEERAHYSKKTIDFEYDFPFGRKELYGLAYRTDFDLKNHQASSGQSLEYTDPQTGEKFIPHVIEPTWGVDRSILAVLVNSYDDSDPAHIILHLAPKLAPYKVAVFPLLKNKPELVNKAREIYLSLVTGHLSLGPIAWDERGNVGKRYYSQDEIGTPYCVTVDFQTLEDNTVTIRDRDTAKQERISTDELEKFITSKLSS